ncbi:MAG: FkbM family methyltransferase [Candidatus Korobacteraceae bacterium]
MRLSALVPLPAKLFLWERFTRLKRKMVGNHVEALLANGRNGRLLIDLEDQNVGRKLSFSGEYGWDEVERLRGYVTPASDVLFVGSHVGAIVVPIAKSCRSVVAVEANPRTFRLLQLNVVLNDCMNVEPINCAASDKEEELQFLMNRVNPGGSKRMPKVHKYMYFSDSPDVITVNGSRLDDVLAGRSFDVIFMDIEGSEYFALGGMPRLLAAAHVLCMEFVPHHLKNVSGVSVAQLLALIEPYFSSLFIPTKNLNLTREQFQPVLQEMYDKEQLDDGIVFTR